MDFLNFVWIFVLVLGINYFIFIFAFIFKTDVLTDITYSLTFSIVTIVLLIWHQQTNIFQMMLFFLVNLWAIRLGTYTFLRIWKIKQDPRFNRIRTSFWKMLAFWTFQVVTIYLVGLPVFFMLTINSSYFANDFYSIIGVMIALFFLAYEAIADAQKYGFYEKKLRSAKEPIIMHGLWKSSRHPNYFGEICFWFSVTIILIWGYFEQTTIKNNLHVLFLLFLLSPTFIALMLNFVSGVQILELNNYKKYAKNQNYIAYIATTSCIVPYLGKDGFVLRVIKHQNVSIIQQDSNTKQKGSEEKKADQTTKLKAQKDNKPPVKEKAEATANKTKATPKN